MEMTICEKCGAISYWDDYFSKYVCSLCRHTQKEETQLKWEGAGESIDPPIFG